MGPQEDYIEAVVTCEGDFHDPKLQDRLQRFQQRLESLLLEDGKKQLILKKVEPWNSVRVTFNIPKHAALRLKQLAEQGSASLRQIGVLGVQIQGDRLVSLTVATPNNQRAELIINTHDESGQSGTSGVPSAAVAGASHDPGLPSSSEELGSPGASMEVTRKNIEEYLRQGFGSILTPSSSAAGPSGAGPSGMDMFKARALPVDGGPVRTSYVPEGGIPGPSGLNDLRARSTLPGNRGHPMGAFTPAAVSGGVLMPGQLGPRAKAADPLAQQQHQHPQERMDQQLGMIAHQQHEHMIPHPQPQQQGVSQGTALPQTAAVGYNMMELPPPPPYPHGPGKGAPNNVSRKKKKGTPSSPLLINLLQTEPRAGTNSVMATPGTGDKPKKKRRPKKKVAAALDNNDGQFLSSGNPSLPLDPNKTSGIGPLQTGPTEEEMSAVLHRRVSPIPLPTPSVIGFTSTAPDHRVVSEGFRERPPPTASAALVSLAHNQRTSVESGSDTIINPYTGHLEPRDSADLSPVREQHKSPGGSLPKGARTGVVSADSNLPAPFSTIAAEDSRTGTGDSVHIGLGSFHPETTVPSSSISLPSSSPITSVSLSSHTAGVSRTGLTVQPTPGAPARTTSTPSPLPGGAAGPTVYARLPVDPSHMMPRPLAAGPRRSSHPLLADTVNVTSTPTSIAVSSGQPLVQLDSHQPMMAVTSEAGERLPVHHPALRPQSSVHTNTSHNVSVGDVRLRGMVGVGGMEGGHVTAGNHQTGPVTNTQPVKPTPSVVADVRQGVPLPAPLSVQQQNDSLKLLNSSSTVVGVVQRLTAETAGNTTSHSPAGSKPPSDGDDNSNHSPVSQIGPSSLLDANGTKVENHDSGVGSSSERSDDMTPSEVGDSEFHTTVSTTEPSATDSNGSKAAVGVKKAVVNCEKVPSSDQHSLTVGYVQANQHSAGLYSKESSKPAAESLLLGEKATLAETYGQVSQLSKSSDLLPVVSQQTALAAHKAGVSVSRPDRVNSPQHQRLMKQLAMAKAQNSGVHQNGPLPLPARDNLQHSPAVRLPNSTRTTVHHPTGITVTPNPGHLSLGASGGQVLQPPAGSIASNPALSHTPVPNSLAVHHPSPSTPSNPVLRHMSVPPNSLPLHHAASSVASKPALSHGGVPSSLAVHHVSVSVPNSHHAPSAVPNNHGLHHTSVPAPTNQAPHRVLTAAPSNHHPAPVQGGQVLHHLHTSAAGGHHPPSSPLVSSQVVVASSAMPHPSPSSVASSQAMPHPATCMSAQVVPQSAGHGVPSGGLHASHTIPSCRAQAVLPPGHPAFNSQAAAVNRVVRPVSSPQVSGQLISKIGSVVSCTAGHSSNSAGAPSLVSSGGGVLVSVSQGQKTLGGEVTSFAGPSPSTGVAAASGPAQKPQAGEVQGIPGHNQAVSVGSRMSSQFLHGRLSNGPTSVGVASHNAVPHGLPPHCVASPAPVSRSSFSLGPPTHSPTPHPHPHPPQAPNTINHITLQGQQHQGQKAARSIPSPQVVVSPHEVSSGQLSNSQLVSSTMVTAVANSLPVSVSVDQMGKHQMAVVETTDGGSPPQPTLKQASPRQVATPSSAAISLPANNLFCDIDINSMASDLVDSGAMSDLDFAEAIFDQSDDLSLLMEPGLMEVGLRHSSVNGSEGASTESRGGANITSMYAKRSSPINVNMLNHIYAAGLPQPRRLTESVQRLVKPLPNPENSLLPGRTCKSPGASSRHSSNGSMSPGRASQGGAKSPVASVGSAARSLSMDRGMSSLPPAASSHSPAVAASQVVSDSSSLNSVYTTNSSTAPPLVATQSPMTNGPQFCSASGHVAGQPSAVGVSSVTTTFPSVAVSSARSPRRPSVPHVTVASGVMSAQPQGDGAVLPRNAVSLGVQQAPHNHSSSGPEPPVSFVSAVPVLPNSHPSSTPFVSLPLPALVPPEGTQASPSVSRVSCYAVSSSSGGAVSAVVSTVPAVRQLQDSAMASYVAGSHQPPASVCNTSSGLDSLPGSGRVLPSTASLSSSVSRPLPSSAAAVPPPTSVSPSSVPKTSSRNQQQQQQNLPTMSTNHTRVTDLALTSVPSSSDLSTNTSATVAVQGSSAAVPAVSVSRSLPVSSLAVSEFQVVSTKAGQGHRPAAVTISQSVSVAEGRTVTSAELTASVHKNTKAAVAAVSSIESRASGCLTVSGSTASVTVTSHGGSTTKQDSSRMDKSAQGSLPVSVEGSVSKSQSASEGTGPPVGVKESERGEREGEQGANRCTVPTSPVQDDVLQDSGHNSQWGGGELHSKPPLLHPTPPLTLPIVISSATPPPPPLTPMLPQDSNKREGASFPSHNTSPLSANNEDLMSVFTTKDSVKTASSLPLGGDLTSGSKDGTVSSADSADNSSISAGEGMVGLSDTTANHPVAKEETEEVKPYTSGLPSSATSHDESNLQMRRGTRKRKTTHSESDSSTTSEPAPKLSCMDKDLGAADGEESVSSAAAADHPPKLHRERKRSGSSNVDKKEEDNSRKRDDKGMKSEDEKEEKKDEKHGGKHSDKNILEATPEEVAKKLAAVTSGSKRKIHYTYVLDKPGQSYFDTPVLSGRTRSQGIKGPKEGAAATPGAAPTALTSGGSQAAAGVSMSTNKEDGGESAGSGLKRSKRSLRMKDGVETTLGKRKRSREPR